MGFVQTFPSAHWENRLATSIPFMLVSSLVEAILL